MRPWTWKTKVLRIRLTQSKLEIFRNQWTIKWFKMTKCLMRPLIIFLINKTDSPSSQINVKQVNSTARLKIAMAMSMSTKRSQHSTLKKQKSMTASLTYQKNNLWIWVRLLGQSIHQGITIYTRTRLQAIWYLNREIMCSLAKNCLTMLLHRHSTPLWWKAKSR